MRSETMKLQKEASKGAVEDERQRMLFRLNLEQYTCVLRQQAIMLYVEERVGEEAAREA